jgi:putrescine importer
MPARPQTKFRRVLKRRDLIIYGLVILTPTAPYPVFGIIQQLSNGHVALSYFVAMVAMLFTAVSYGRMATAFPTAGSTYAYARHSLNEHVGFVAGWSMALDYFLIPLLSVVYISITAARLAPTVPYWTWVILFNALITIINLHGIRMTARASSVLMVLMTVCALLFIALATRWIVLTHGFSDLFVMEGLVRNDTFSAHALMLGAGIATLSYIGFDAISTLAEESVAPERDIPVATVLVCVLQALICIVTVYLAARVWPTYDNYPQVETVILDIGGRIGGAFLFHFITLILLVAGLASSLTGQAGASRLLFAMGRDGVISGRLFGHLSARHATPDRAIYVMSAVSLIGAFFIDFQLSVELVNFGAFVGFILVNLSVIAHFYVRLRRRSGSQVWSNLVFPALGALICTWVWMSLTMKARIVGFGWLAVGIIYLAVLTRGFRKPVMALEV